MRQGLRLQQAAGKADDSGKGRRAPEAERERIAFAEAAAIADEDVASCRSIRAEASRVPTVALV